MSSPVTTTRSGGIAHIVVDHAPVNAMSADVIDGLTDALRHVGASDARVVTIRGAGRTFLAGADISEFPALLKDPAKVEEHVASTRPLFELLGSIPQPVVAVVRGAAVGGGLEIALACDLVIADENAKLGLPELKLGLIPGGGGTQRLPRLVGRVVAGRMIFGAEILRAKHALELGIVSHVVSHDGFDEEVEAIVGRVGSMPRAALAAAKRSLRDGLDQPLHEALLVEERHFMPLFQSPDVQEGYDAFIQKRPPRFA